MNGKGYTDYGTYERVDGTLILFATEQEAYDAKREREEEDD